MSSSNLVSLTYEEETTYGAKNTPISGVTLQKVRMTSESLSGTPETSESEETRTDRMSAGQVAVGLNVVGDINFELSPDTFFDDFFEAGMMSTWVAKTQVSAQVTLTPSTSQQATLVLSASLTGAAAGDLVQIRPDGASFTKFTVSIISVTTPGTEFEVATPRDQAAMTTEDSFVSIPQYVEIGTTQKSFVIGKAYEDVLHLLTTDEHSQTYNGMLVSALSVAAQYGERITGSFTLLGNGYVQENPSYQQAVIAGGGSVAAAGTTNPLNASIDMPLTVLDGEATDFCVENLTVTLDNGLDPRNCLGYQAPTGYSLGTAQVGVNADIYLSDTSYDALMAKKLSQVPISFAYVSENAEGGYAFQMPALQLSFPDPANEGRNQQTMMRAEGQAKVGPNGESALRIYKLEA